VIVPNIQYSKISMVSTDFRFHERLTPRLTGSRIYRRSGGDAC